MTGAALANHAAFGAALAGVMAAVDIGSIPVDVRDGHIVAFGPEGMEQGELEPLVRSEHVEIDVKEVPGYWESAGGNGTSPSVELKRGWLESRSFFKDWSSLQEDANWVSSIPRDRFADFINLARSDFALALLRHAMGTDGDRVVARRNYETVAIRYEVEKNFTAAAMVWERAATNPDHLIPERLRKLHRGRAASAWYRSVPRPGAELDPISLRFARGIWHAYGSDEKYYRMLLMKSAKWNERIARPFDAGAYRLRLAFSILSGEKVSRASLSVAANMIVSAARLFEGSERGVVGMERLKTLAQRVGKVSEVA